MITLCNLSSGYEKNPVLKGINAEIPSGRVTGIIGPNGCGKSTLLRAMLGLIQARDGEIFIDGKPLSSLSHRARAQRMAFLPQQRPIPEITVEELVSLGRYAHLGSRRTLSNRDHTIIEEALLQSGAAPFRHDLLSRLSGGQQQRAYLGKMLAQDANHLMLDEPTNHLDPSGQLEWMELIKSLGRQGKAVIVVLHDLPLAMEYCDEIMVLEQGQLKAKGAPQALLSQEIPEQVFKVRLREHQGRYTVSPL